MRNERDDETTEPFFSQEGSMSLDASVLYQWDLTRTMKPMNDFVKEYNSCGIKSLDRILIGDVVTTTMPQKFLSSGKPILVWNESYINSFVDFFLLVYHHVVTYCMAIFRGRAQENEMNLNDKLRDKFIPTQMNQFCTFQSIDTDLAEEDGLCASRTPSHKSSNTQFHLRFEERIRREIDVTQHDSKNAKSIQGREVHDVAHENIEEILCLAPGEQHQMSRRHCKERRDIVVTINVKEIKFRRHPYFSAEETAIDRITDLYDAYRVRVDAETLHNLVTQLVAILQYIQPLYNVKNGDADTYSMTWIDSYEDTLNDLTTTSEKLLEESNCIKELSFRIKQQWEVIASARKNSGFISTDIELQNEKSSSKRIEDDLRSLNDAVISSHAALSTITDRENVALQSSVKALQAVEKILCDVDHLKVKHKLVLSKNFAQTGWIPEEEIHRRRRISSERYFVRLIINSHFVGDTRINKIQLPSFSVRLDHRFECRLSQGETNVCLQIFKTTSTNFLSNLVSSLYVKIPCHEEIVSDASEEESAPFIERYDFANKNGLKGSVFISSITKVRLCMPTQASTTTLVPLKNSSVNGRSRYLIRQPTIHNSNEGLIKSLRTEIDVSEGVYDHERQSRMAFTSNPGRILFSNNSMLTEPTRHTLIKKRQHCPHLFTSPIPNVERTIEQNETYNALIKTNNESIEREVINDALKERTAVNRRNASLFLKAIEDHSLMREKKAKTKYSKILQDSVLLRFVKLEDFIIPIPPKKRSLFPTPTQPVTAVNVQNRSSLVLSVIGAKNIPMKDTTKMIRQEVNAFDEKNVSNDRAADTWDDGREAYLGLVVKIKFRGKFYVTKAVSEAKNPFWNETIVLPLGDIIQSSQCLSPLHCHEVIEIYLFDCVNVDMRNEGGFYDDEDTRLLEYLYLGSATIHLSTILQEGQVDGFMQCSSPDIILGYLTRSIVESNYGTSKNDVSGNTEIVHNEQRHHLLRHGRAQTNALLRMYATIKPKLSVSTKIRHEYPSSESQPILTQENQWSQKYFNCNDRESSGKICCILWPAVHGISYLVNRFLTEHNPPTGFETLESCAHYVSLIPSLCDWKALENTNYDRNIILTCQQTINIIAGNIEEHAILLANYYLYLSKKKPIDCGADVYLILGLSVPEGKTVWVMRRCQRSGEITFWDSMSGSAYSRDDVACPLQQIYCLVSKENIYANLFIENRPHALDFNLSNVRHWAPFHVAKSKGHESLHLTTIQEETLHYLRPNDLYAKNLQNDLKDSIKNSIRDWRRVTTSFRSDVGVKLNAILEKLEESRIDGQGEEIIVLEDVAKTRTAFGFPLHFPFTNISHVIDRIEATEIHRNRNPRVEFAIGVRAFPYPGGVMSVWVFICSLTPTR